jgi:hypothetical protein
MRTIGNHTLPETSRQFIRKIILLTVLGAISALLQAPRVNAAAITWGVVGNITANSDVSTVGTSDYAYDWASSAGSQTVNGVSFTGTTSTSPGGNVGLSGTGIANAPSSYTTASASLWTTFKSAYPQYEATLIGGDYMSANVVCTVTLNNLTIGNSYEVQVWVNDPRNG